MSTLTIQHIESRDDVCGGKPCVKGTRIRVWDIHIWHDLRGQSPEEIAATYPQLSLADIHAALAFFLDHHESIKKQMDADQADVAQMESQQGSTKFSRLRDELLKGKDNDADSVSSG